mmetsp:Transcript_45557/g.74401  ORF Transcript_45557/g.74401 Transcript_45557/m.74401 type:complete len:215 (+) Transcript_45557:2120-2764(+)
MRTSPSAPDTSTSVTRRRRRSDSPPSFKVQISRSRRCPGRRREPCSSTAPKRLGRGSFEELASRGRGAAQCVGAEVQLRSARGGRCSVAACSLGQLHRVHAPKGHVCRRTAPYHLALHSQEPGRIGHGEVSVSLAMTWTPRRHQPHCVPPSCSRRRCTTNAWPVQTCTKQADVGVTLAPPGRAQSLFLSLFLLFFCVCKRRLRRGWSANCHWVQ